MRTQIVGEKFEETKLTTKNEFYSKLKITGIKDQEYEHLQQV